MEEAGISVNFIISVFFLLNSMVVDRTISKDANQLPFQKAPEHWQSELRACFVF